MKELNVAPQVGTVMQSSAALSQEDNNVAVEPAHITDNRQRLVKWQQEKWTSCIPLHYQSYFEKAIAKEKELLIDELNQKINASKNNFELLLVEKKKDLNKKINSLLSEIYHQWIGMRCFYKEIDCLVAELKKDTSLEKEYHWGCVKIMAGQIKYLDENGTVDEHFTQQVLTCHTYLNNPWRLTNMSFQELVEVEQTITLATKILWSALLHKKKMIDPQWVPEDFVNASISNSFPPQAVVAVNTLSSSWGDSLLPLGLFDNLLKEVAQQSVENNNVVNLPFAKKKKEELWPLPISLPVSNRIDNTEGELPEPNEEQKKHISERVEALYQQKSDEEWRAITEERKKDLLKTVYRMIREAELNKSITEQNKSINKPILEAWYQQQVEVYSNYETLLLAGRDAIKSLSSFKKNSWRYVTEPGDEFLKKLSREQQSIKKNFLENISSSIESGGKRLAEKIETFTKCLPPGVHSLPYQSSEFCLQLEVKARNSVVIRGLDVAGEVVELTLSDSSWHPNIWRKEYLTQLSDAHLVLLISRLININNLLPNDLTRLSSNEVDWQKNTEKLAHPMATWKYDLIFVKQLEEYYNRFLSGWTKQDFDSLCDSLAQEILKPLHAKGYKSLPPGIFQDCLYVRREAFLERLPSKVNKALLSPTRLLASWQQDTLFTTVLTAAMEKLAKSEEAPAGVATFYTKSSKAKRDFSSFSIANAASDSLTPFFLDLISALIIQNGIAAKTHLSTEEFLKELQTLQSLFLKQLNQEAGKKARVVSESATSYLSNLPLYKEDNSKLLPSAQKMEEGRAPHAKRERIFSP